MAPMASRRRLRTTQKRRLEAQPRRRPSGTPSPSLVNPAKNLRGASGCHILGNMPSWLITAEEEQEALATRFDLPHPGPPSDHIPQYTEHVRKAVAKVGKSNTGTPWLDHGLKVSMAVEAPPEGRQPVWAEDLRTWWGSRLPGP